jgi:hypothetical protein
MRMSASEGRVVLERRAGLWLALALGVVAAATLALALRSASITWAHAGALSFLVVLALVALAMPFSTDAVQRLELARTADGVEWRWLLGSTFGPLRVVEEVHLAAELVVVRDTLLLGGRKVLLAQAGGRTERALRRLVEGPPATSATVVDPSGF